MKRLTNEQIDDAYEYLHSQWTACDEGWHDYSAADASGDVELMSYILWYISKHDGLAISYSDLYEIFEKRGES